MNIAYVNASLNGIKLKEQERLLNKYKIDIWFKDQDLLERTELDKVLLKANGNDVLYIYEFSRIAKTTSELVEKIKRFKSKGITLISVKEKFDSSTKEGKNVFDVIEMISEFEKINNSERKKVSIEYARKEGKSIGRQSIQISARKFDKLYGEYLNRRITKIQFANMIQVTRPTLDKFIKAFETKVIVEENGLYHVDSTK